jgi:hypothetical protein
MTSACPSDDEAACEERDETIDAGPSKTRAITDESAADDVVDKRSDEAMG